MADAKKTVLMKVSKEQLFETILDVESYPKFVDGVKKTKIREKKESSMIVDYELSVMKTFTYSILLQWNAEKTRVFWSLIESDLFSKNDGSWDLVEKSNQTEVTYSLDVEFKVKVPGFILKSLVSGSLPTMLSSFEKESSKRK